jgi:hypothetical protein
LTFDVNENLIVSDKISPSFLKFLFQVAAA